MYRLNVIFTLISIIFICELTYCADKVFMHVIHDTTSTEDLENMGKILNFEKIEKLEKEIRDVINKKTIDNRVRKKYLQSEAPVILVSALISNDQLNKLDSLLEDIRNHILESEYVKTKKKIIREDDQFIHEYYVYRTLVRESIDQLIKSKNYLKTFELSKKLLKSPFAEIRYLSIRKLYNLICEEKINFNENIINKDEVIETTTHAIEFEKNNFETNDWNWGDFLVSPVTSKLLVEKATKIIDCLDG